MITYVIILMNNIVQSQRLGAVWPRLLEIPFGESLGNLLLQTRANKRIHAEQALRHRLDVQCGSKTMPYIL